MRVDVAPFSIITILAVLLMTVMLSCTSEEPEVTEEAETAYVALGVVRHLESAALGERRTLNIYLPPGYEEDATTSYPVIYLLDGAVDEDYHHVSGLIQFLVAYNLMPASIVVGIANVDRYRDFTHPTVVEEHKNQLPTSGGSEAFRAFLKTELQPFIESNYRTAPTRTLIGQSLGGLLATEVFIETPDLFEKYMIVSPSLWWDEGTLIARMEDALKRHPSRTGELYIALGSEGEEMQEGVDRFVAALQAHAPPTLTWHSLSFPEETHATLLHRGLYRGLELFYEDTYTGY